MAAEGFGSASTLQAAAIFASLMAPNLVGSSLNSRLSPETAQNRGMVLFLLSMAGAVFFLRAGQTIGFFFMSLCAGTAWGAAFSGGMRSLLARTAQEDRAGVLSAVFLIAYCGAAIPNLIVSRLAPMFGLADIALGYLVLVAAACILTVVFSRGQRRKGNTAS